MKKRTRKPRRAAAPDTSTLHPIKLAPIAMVEAPMPQAPMPSEVSETRITYGEKPKWNKMKSLWTRVWKGLIS